ncbi:MAG TPA: glycosyl hydrolase family 28-related protein [Nitrososphaeraceae archaeon]|nr:glycosyl hydrolase family 28-related protein [Nitrososphaeraceae archaeon]
MRIIALLLTCTCVHAILLNSSQRVDWTGNVGIPGGIPNRTTIFTTVSVDTSGTSDTSGAINSAIASCPPNQVVMLPPGKLRLNNTIFLRNNVTLRGAGMTNTTFISYKDFPIVFRETEAFEVNRSITGGLTKGSSVLTLSDDVSNYKVGHQLLLDQANDPNWMNPNGTEGPGNFPDQTGGNRPYARARGMYSEIVGKSGQQITIAQPLCWDFTGGYNPLARVEVGGSGLTGIRYAGIENFSITNLATIVTDQDQYMVWFDTAAYCWMKNIELRKAYNQAVKLRKAYRCEVTGCSFIQTRNPGSAGSSQAYCVQMDFTSSWNKIVNNISDYLLNIFILEYSASCNFIADNFVTNSVYYDQTWQAADMSIHALHCGFNLVEGNIGDHFMSDYIHGSSSHNTLYRNYFRGKKQTPNKPTLHLRCIELSSNQRYFNVINNVMGSQFWGVTGDIYKAGAGNQHLYSDAEVELLLGYKDVGGLYFEWDAGVTNTLNIHGNWDKVNNRVVYDPANPDRAFPPSFANSVRPDYWGTNYAWPSIGGDVNPVNGMNPAMRRYLGISEGGGGAPAPIVRNFTIAASLPGGAPAPLITTSPADINGQGSGVVTFSRVYPDATTVTLTAPANTGGAIFNHWDKNGVLIGATTTVNVLANNDYVLTAVYTYDPGENLTQFIQTTVLPQ